MAMNPLAIANLMSQAAQEKAENGPQKPKGKQIAAIKAKSKGAKKPGLRPGGMPPAGAPPMGPGPQGQPV